MGNLTLGGYSKGYQTSHDSNSNNDNKTQANARHRTFGGMLLKGINQPWTCVMGFKLTSCRGYKIIAHLDKVESPNHKPEAHGFFMPCVLGCGFFPVMSLNCLGSAFKIISQGVEGEKTHRHTHTPMTRLLVRHKCLFMSKQNKKKLCNLVRFIDCSRRFVFCRRNSEFVKHVEVLYAFIFGSVS